MKTFIIITLILLSVIGYLSYLLWFKPKKGKTVIKSDGSEEIETPLTREDREFQKEVDQDILKVRKQEQHLRKRKMVEMVTDNTKEVMGYTSFIYEDGNPYYFRVITRNDNSYHYLKCYKKVREKFVQVGDGELIKTDFGPEDIKSEIKQILKQFTHTFNWDEWDGVVGDIPEHIRREGRFKQLLDKKVNDKGV